MKTLRFFTIILLAVLVFTTWAPAYAKPLNTGTTSAVDLAGKKLGRLRVTNQTGGALYVHFQGKRSYNFATAKQGKTTFDAIIEPGMYAVTVTTSACKGQLSFKRNVKPGATVGLPGFRCVHK